MFMEEKIKHRVQTYSESKNSIFYRLIKKILLNERKKFVNYLLLLTEYNDKPKIIRILHASQIRIVII